MKFVSGILICLVLLAVQVVMPGYSQESGAAGADSPEAQRQELMKLLEEISALEQQRDQQRQTLDRLEQQVQCQFTLIQEYERCGDEFSGNNARQLDCIKAAREQARRCMEGISPP